MQLLLVSACDALTRRVTDFASALNGYQIRRCVDAGEACQLMDAGCGTEQAVILDLVSQSLECILPAMTAWERLLAAADAPAIVIYTDSDAVIVIQALDPGTAEWVRMGDLTPEKFARTLSSACERFRTRRTLCDLHDELQLLLRGVPVLLWTTGVDLCLRRVSDMAAQLCAQTPQAETLMGHSVTQLLHGDDGGVTTRMMHQQALQGERVAYQTTCRGSCLSIIVAPLRHTDGQIVGTVGVGFDISDQQALGEQLSAARQVQESLLPRQLPRPARVELAGAAFPAHNTGGDWYDVLELPDGSLVLIVGDVSGHDLPATILAAACSAYLHALVATSPDWQQILATANQLVWKRTRPQDFAMLQLGWINAERTTFTYAGAGDRVLLVDSRGELKATIPSVGPPLGLFAPEQARFDPPVSVELAPGDTLLMLTDGFREARNPSGEMFGEARVIKAVAQHRQRSADEILRAVYREVEGFAEGQPPEDDMSGIIFRVRGRP